MHTNISKKHTASTFKVNVSRGVARKVISQIQGRKR
jgi:hypothetical protein